MPKIKCPHCGANNQDVTEKERCWQCDLVLGAAPTPVDPAQTPPTAPTPMPVQKQVEPRVPAPRPAAPPSQRRLPMVPIAIVIVLALIVLAIILFLMKK